MRNDHFLQPEEWKVYFLRANEKQAHSREAHTHIWEDTLIASEQTWGIDEVQGDQFPSYTVIHLIHQVLSVHAFAL